MIEAFLIETIEKIGYLNFMYCGALLLSGSLAKTLFDDTSEGMTTKIINWTALFLGLFFLFLGADWFELIIATLAFQRFFRLVGYRIEQAYYWLFKRLFRLCGKFNPTEQ